MIKKIILFLLILNYNYVLSQETLMYRIQDSTKSESDWYLGKSTDGHFLVELPIPFNDFTVKAGNFYTYVIGSESIEKIKFSVSEMKNKKLLHRVNLDKIINDLEDSNSSISNISKYKNKAYKSVYCEIKNQEYGSFMKYVYYKKRIYTLIIEYPLSQEEVIIKYKDYFFNSFKIKNKKTKKYELH